jgi:hypothetical protein
MNFKTTYILAGILAAILLLLGTAVFLGPENPGGDAYLLPTVRAASTKVDADDIDKIVIERTKSADGLESMTLVRDKVSGLWTIESPGPFRADDGQVRELVRQLFEARNDDRAERPRSDSEWGLDSPSGTVVVSSESKGKSFTINLGKTSPGTTSAVVYMKSSDRQGAIAVLKSTVATLFKTSKALRDPYLLASSSSDITKFEISEGKKTPIEVKKSGEQWRYAKPADWGDAEMGAFGAPEEKEKTPAGVNAVLTAISNIRVSHTDEKVTDYVADAATDLAKYGLDPSKDRILKLSIDRSVVAKSVGDDKAGATTNVPVTLLVAVGKKEGEKYFAALDEAKKNIVRVPARDIDPLLKLLDDPGALRDKTLVKVSGKFDAFDIEGPSGKLEFRRTADKPWQLWRPGSTAATELDTTIVETFLNQITQKDSIKSFINGPVKDQELGLDKPQATISLWVNGIVTADAKKEEAKTEKKDEKASPKPDSDKPQLVSTGPKLKLTIGKTEGPLVIVRRTGTPDTLVAKVDGSLATNALRGPVAYLDKNLPSFNPGAQDPSENVTRLKLVRAGKTVEIAREKADTPWKFISPAEQSGLAVSANTVRGLLGTINNLRALSIISEKATDAQLDKDFGLKAPTTQVVVTTGKDKEAKTWEFTFGKETPEKTGFFAKQSWRDLVFTIDKLTPATLEAELAETTLFAGTEIAKIETVRMVGWQAVTGSPFTLELQRVQGKWQSKSPANFAIDSAKVDKFLSDVTNLRVEKFVSFATPAKPEQNFDPAKGGMSLEFTSSGEKETRKLWLGKSEGDFQVAQASKIPGAIFTLRNASLAPALAKPAHFNP